RRVECARRDHAERVRRRRARACGCRRVPQGRPTRMSGGRLPRLPVAGDRDPSRAHWMELFFDLVFVALVGQLAHGLHAEPSFGTLAVFVALFASVWWSWV